MKERMSPVGEKMKFVAASINEVLEQAGVDIREFSVQYFPKCKDSDEGVEWTFVRQDGNGECYVDFTENGAEVIEHKLEDLGNQWPEEARIIFLKYEPQLAVLRQLLNMQNDVLKITKKIAKMVARNMMNC